MKEKRLSKRLAKAKLARAADVSTITLTRVEDGLPVRDANLMAVFSALGMAGPAELWQGQFDETPESARGGQLRQIRARARTVDEARAEVRDAEAEYERTLAELQGVLREVAALAEREEAARRAHADADVRVGIARALLTVLAEREQEQPAARPALVADPYPGDVGIINLAADMQEDEPVGERLRREQDEAAERPDA